METELLLFGIAFAVSAAVPGPDTMLLFSRTLERGATAGIAVAIGLTLGKLLLLTAALLGLSALAIALGPLFVMIKIAGAVYLVFLGIKLWRRASGTRVASPPHQRSSQAQWAKNVSLGVAITLSNPQALLFYVAVLPTIVGSRPLSAVTLVALAATLAAIMIVVAGLYVGLASKISAALTAKRRRLTDRASAVIMVATGVVIAVR